MPRLELSITLHETGQIAVTGPIDQTLVCYGLLELARDVIRDHAAKAQQRLVQPVNAPLPRTPVGS